MIGRNFLSYKKSPKYRKNLYLRRIYLIRGTTQIGLHPLTRILTYTPPGNGCGLRQSLLPAMCFAPVSDLPSKVHSAIPSILQSHHLQLSVISAKCLLLFLIGLSLLVLIIMRQKGFVNHFFQTIGIGPTEDGCKTSPDTFTYRCSLAFAYTCSPVSNCIRHIRTCVLKMRTT